jgi:hypothetical protein
MESNGFPMSLGANQFHLLAPISSISWRQSVPSLGANQFHLLAPISNGIEWFPNVSWRQPLFSNGIQWFPNVSWRQSALIGARSQTIIN